ncbi:K+ channel tetramerization domain-containing protein [Aspergillus taichungensis]|uniref:K+ channel tetramerization domain-containing protein n=1 Tax=Aspergillus taichungensis TaxID=482145 RepID=A0A2J5HY74_9EURO|nr:K+ channel tetramerization domain-containing protein [Aspergillus taichungensis]
MASASPQGPASASPTQSMLPLEKVFSIQIGTELFRLSGASVASDAPSYFSRFFEEQLCQSSDGSNIRTLYIDRDPVTFQQIARHLQGYHVQPRDGSEYVKLFADAQFYSLPRLISQLFESEIFIQIGDRNFQIPRDLFNGPGDSPNFFSLGFAAFFASKGQIFPGLDRHGLLRPPAITPTSVPSRSGEVFAQILHLLRGYPLHIKNREHREELLRDCTYYHLRGLEQKLIPHDISFNPILGSSEIVIGLEHVRRSGLQVPPPSSGGGWVTYSRPYTDDETHDLILEVGDQSTVIDLHQMRARFLNLAKMRVATLLRVVADQLREKTQGTDQSGETSPDDRGVPIRLDPDMDLTVNGQATSYAEVFTDPDQGHPAKRRRLEEGDTTGTAGIWNVSKGQWRLHVQCAAHQSEPDFSLVAVKLDVYTGQRLRNRARPFLGP